MKDFFDLYRIALLETLETPTLRQALERTFAARGIPLEAARTILSEDFMRDETLGQRWSQFLRRTTLTAPTSLEEVLRVVLRFLTPALEDTG